MTTAAPVTRCRHCGVFLPAPPPYGPASAAWAQVSCPRCGRRPDGRRWVAHPPGAPAVPGQTGPPTTPLPRVPRVPPGTASRPSPAGTGDDPRARPHPRWGLPTVAWVGPSTPRPTLPNPRPILTTAALLLTAVAVLALLSAAAETWRFVLLLQGRTAVLPSGVVATSDVLVAVAGLFTPVVTVAALVVAVVAVLRTSSWAADRAGLRPPRSRPAMLLRLLVPGWNVYGVGQVLVETHALLLAPPAAADVLDPIDRSSAVRRRDHRLIGVWWCAWVVNVALLVATLARGLGGSLQAVADTVELHIALDVAAAVTAGLAAVVVRRFRTLTDVTPTARSRWVVQAPAPTRGRPDQPHDSSTGSTDDPASSGDPTKKPHRDERAPGSATPSRPAPSAAPDDDRDPADPSATVSA